MWKADLRKEPTKRECFHFEVDQELEGKEPLIILRTQAMLQDAVELGHCEPIYMDASHGMQRYGLKVVTLHVKDIAIMMHCAQFVRIRQILYTVAALNIEPR
jgi:hypothetical protein